MKQPPSPAEVDRDLRAIAEDLARLRAAYRVAYDAVYRQRSGGSGGRVQRGTSDPTGQLAGARQGARRRVLRAARLTGEASSKLAEAIADLHASLREPRAEREAYEPTIARYPRVVTRAEIADSEAARERRHERGEE